MSDSSRSTSHVSALLPRALTHQLDATIVRAAGDGVIGLHGTARAETGRRHTRRAYRKITYQRVLDRRSAASRQILVVGIAAAVVRVPLYAQTPLRLSPEQISDCRQRSARLRFERGGIEVEVDAGHLHATQCAQSVLNRTVVGCGKVDTHHFPNKLRREVGSRADGAMREPQRERVLRVVENVLLPRSHFVAVL